MESIGVCEVCGEAGEWYAETHRFKVSIDGVSAPELMDSVPICEECMNDLIEDDGPDEWIEDNATV